MTNDSKRPGRTGEVHGERGSGPLERGPPGNQAPLHGRSRLGNVRDALDQLDEGGLISFPTETLWSLSCIADDEQAVDRLLAAKGRPQNVPLAVGFPEFLEARLFVDANAGARRLAKAFMPGPISLVMEREEEAFAHLAPGRTTLSVRVPDHPVAQEILRQTGPLVMTSANRHGQSDWVGATQVVANLVDAGVLVVSAPDVPGIASTVVDVTGDEPRILRQGAISAAEVMAAWR